MDKSVKTEPVIMSVTSQTTDIGSFEKGQEIWLTPKQAAAVVKAKIGKRSKKEGRDKKKDNKAPQEAGDKHIEKEEVTDDGGE